MKRIELHNFPIFALFIAMFSIVSLMAFFTIKDLQGNARIVNYTGIVRGATQQLVKQELHGVQNDQLIRHLDEIITALQHGNTDLRLTVLPSAAYQELLVETTLSWGALKEEIALVRRGGDGSKLFEQSEAHFTLVNHAVHIAETYSEEQTRRAMHWLGGLCTGFVLLTIFGALHTARQNKMRAALQEARSASREKSKFLSRMSHEIRTPMNGIIGMTALAKQNIDNRNKLSDCLYKIEQCSNFLLALINDILDMSRIESGKVMLCPTPFRFERLIEDIQAMFSLQAADKRIAFSVQASPFPAKALLGDALRIRQIIVNLLSNALKFTPENGRVLLTAQVLKETPEGVSIRCTVEDSGIGMSDAFMQTMFEPFSQAAHIVHQYGGTGLGLSISRNLVQMMQGEIHAESTLGQGTKFTVLLRLPFAEAAADTASVQPLSAEPPTLSGARMLLAEDNEINAEIACALLAATGAEIEHVWNGQEAVERFAAAPPGYFGLILMDIQMPVLDGLQATAQIRALPREDASQIPILALTANAFSEDIANALQAGMNDHLNKPIDVQRLYRVAASYLKKNRNASTEAPR